MHIAGSHAHIRTDRCRSDMIGQTVSCVYLSRRCHWLCLLWPAAGSAGIRSQCLWKPGAAADLRFQPADKDRVHLYELGQSSRSFNFNNKNIFIRSIDCWDIRI